MALQKNTDVPEMADQDPEEIERLCGPQSWFFLSHVMRTINAQVLREAVVRIRGSSTQAYLEQASRRARLRVINISGPRGAKRREHMNANCISKLQQWYPLLDVGFTEGIVAAELDWTLRPEELGREHAIRETTYNGRTYVANEEAWHGPTQQEIPEMMQRFAEYQMTMQLWPAFLQDCSEAMTWGYVGCQLAHVEAWKAAYDAGFEWLMICEDDIMPTPMFEVDWIDIWGIVAEQIMMLDEIGEGWDLLFVGKGSSVSPEGRFITPLLVECGYNIKMHCYCISRRGMAKILASDLAFTPIRPQDEILASLNVCGRHPRQLVADQIRRLFPDVDSWRSLCFPWWGIVYQLQHFEHHRNSELAQSAIQDLGNKGLNR